MAEKRMFTMKVIDSDSFKEMPLSAQALYFHLVMNADDEGFLNNAKSVQRSIFASDDDMKLLIAKNFIILFESGVVVIKHWKMHNTIQPSRLKPTQYIEEKGQLALRENKAYTLNLNDVDRTSEECQQNVDSLSTECQQNVDRTSEECQQNVGSLSQDSLSQRGQNSAQDKQKEAANPVFKRCQQNVDKMSAECRQNVAESRLEEIRLEEISVGECSVEEYIESHTHAHETTYESLVSQYGKAFVDERIARAKKYAGATIETVAKWCEEDSKKRKSSDRFSNCRQYRAAIDEASLISNNGKKNTY